MYKSYYIFNTATTKLAYETDGFVSVCKIRPDIVMDS